MVCLALISRYVREGALFMRKERRKVVSMELVIQIVTSVQVMVILKP